MRVLHIGNIANNAYNNAKFLRRLGVEADVLVFNYRHVMGQPEWEDADFDGEVDEYNPDWQSVDLGGFVRPVWYRDVLLERAERRQRFRGQLRLLSYLERSRHAARALRRFAALAPLARRRLPQLPAPLLLVDVLRYLKYHDLLAPLMRGYDIIQAYSTDPILAMLMAPTTPLVAFEHGTMREIPFERSPTGRLLSVAYHRARHVIITNPDVISSARRLGLGNYSFVPHPIDEERLAPRESSLAAELRQRYAADLLLFAPSRHNWAIKGNDKLLRAFAAFAGGGRGRAALILCDWGQELERSRQLCAELGVADRVHWIRPLPKLRMVDYYNAADVVLDQFNIGTFGTVAPEAMACAKPVIIHFDPAVHTWCYDEMPPVQRAFTAEEITARLGELADRERREEVGRQSREWICRHHGWRLVAERQLAIYERIMPGGGRARAPRRRSRR